MDNQKPFDDQSKNGHGNGEQAPGLGGKMSDCLFRLFTHLEHFMLPL